MACKCIETVNKSLLEAGYNTLVRDMVLTNLEKGSYRSVVLIETKQAQRGKGQKRKISVTPTYCPFCGTEYLPQEG